MPYAVENALFQWEEGERRLRDSGELRLQAAADAVFEELRRRLGGPFRLSELADLYGGGTDWATDIAERRFASTDASFVVDAAFGRYARFASDYAGGRRYE